MTSDTIILQGDGYGRIWSSTPRVTQEGLISTFATDAPLTGASFASGAEHLAVADQRGQVHVLRIKSNRFSLLSRAGQPCESVLFSRRNKKEVLVAFADHAVRSYSIDQGQLQGTLKGHRTPLSSLSVRSTADELVTCSSDGIVLWDLRKLVRKRTLGGGPYGALMAVFSEDGEYMVTAFKDDTVWVWDATSSTLRYRIRLPFASSSPGALQAVAVSPDSSTLVAAGCSPLLFVYDFARGFLRHCVRLPSQYALRGVRDVKFAPDSRSVAVLCQDGSVLFVDLEEPRLTALIASADPRTHVNSMALDERFNYAALVCQDGKIRLYDLGLLRQTFVGVRDAASYRLAKVPAAEVSSAQAPQSLEQLQESEGPAAPPPADEAALPMGLNTGASTGLVGKLAPRRGDLKGWRAEGAPPQMFRGSVVPGSDPLPTAAPPSDRARPSGRKATPSGLPSSLTLSKLKTLLEGFGEYPEKYRRMIWRRLLALPENTAAFQALASRGLHPAFEDLGERYPLDDRGLLSRLARCLSALAHWCPALAEVTYLPALAFPFVKLFGADELGCFEALASLWMHWLKGWLDNFPAPPVPLLSKWEAVLAQRDPELHGALMARCGGVQGHLWCLFQTALSEVLTRKEWLKVWDHCLTGGPLFLGCFCVAYLEYFRPVLLQARAEEQVALFLRRPNALDLNAVLKAAYDVRVRAPEALLPQVRARDTLPADSAVYPPYTAFPPAAVDLAAKEREKIAQQEKDLARRRVLVQELEERGRALAAQEQAWVNERARLAELEADRRQMLRAQEEALATQRLQLEDRAREERLRQVGAVEEAYRTNLQRLRADWQVELERVRADVEHKQKLMELELRSKKEEEAVASLEFQAQQRVWAMEEEAARQAAAQRLRTAVEAAQVDEWALKTRKQAQWEQEDTELKAKVVQENARKARAVQLEAELAAREQTDLLIQKKQIAAESNLSAIERARRLRLLEEKGALLESEQEAAKKARAAVRQAQDSDHFKRELEGIRELQDRRSQAKRVALEEAEHLRRVERHLRAERAEEVEHGMKRQELKGQLDEYRRAADRESAKEERETRRLLETLEEERRRDRELEVELRMKEQELEARLKFAKVAGEQQGQAEEEERAKFARLREEIRNRLAQEEGEASRKHEEAMAQLALERERQLMELDAMWRKTAAQEELRSLGAQKSSLDHDLERRMKGQVERERILALEVEELKRRVAQQDIGAGAEKENAAPYTNAQAIGELLGADRALIDQLLGQGKAGAKKGGKKADRSVDSVSITDLTHSSLSSGSTVPSSMGGSGSSSSGPSLPLTKDKKTNTVPFSDGTPSDSGSGSADTEALFRELEGRSRAAARARAAEAAAFPESPESGDSLLPRTNIRPKRRTASASTTPSSISTGDLTRGLSASRPPASDLNDSDTTSPGTLMNTTRVTPLPASRAPPTHSRAIPAPPVASRLPFDEFDYVPEDEIPRAPHGSIANSAPQLPPISSLLGNRPPAPLEEDSDDDDAELQALLGRTLGSGHAPPADASGLMHSPDFTVSASTALRRPQGRLQPGDEEEVLSGSNSTDSAREKSPSLGGPRSDQADDESPGASGENPLHSRAYLQAREILERHRSSRGGSSSVSGGDA